VAWVFAYGSLMGDAILARYRARPARLAGFGRAFLHESRRRWGTPDAPCPILGLAPGGECRGLVFEVPNADQRSVLGALEKREAATERARQLRRVETSAGPLDAWVWVSRHRGNGDGTDPDVLAPRLRAAHGVVGTGVEYVRTLVHAMSLHGIGDPLVETLWARLEN